MNDLKDLDQRHKTLVHDIADNIRQAPNPDVAAVQCVDIVAKWLTAPATDLALPDQMQYSTHATACLLRLGEPFDD